MRSGVRLSMVTSGFRPRHLCVYGATAAGKTTHSAILAQQLGIDYVSASALMLDLLEQTDSGGNDIWIHHQRRLNAARNDSDTDSEVNRRIIERLRAAEPAVFDSWTLPFALRDHPDLASQVQFVKIVSDVNSRALKCMVSQGSRPQLDFGGCRDLIRDKDLQSQSIFKAKLGIDVFSKVSPPHQKTISITKFVYGTGVDQIVRGIAQAHAAIVAALISAGYCVNSH